MPLPSRFRRRIPTLPPRFYGVVLTLFAADPAYSFEIQRATDANGTGAISIASGVPGNQRVYVDTIGNNGSAYYYRTRHIMDGETASAWTCWIAGVPRILPLTPTPAEAIGPVIGARATNEASTGTVWVDITDPQCRVTLVEFQVTSAGVPGGWIADNIPPYGQSVGIQDTFNNGVEYRVTGYDAHGVLRILAQGGFIFPVSGGVLATDETRLTAHANVNESGGKKINRLYAKTLAGDVDTFDSVSDGTTYRRIVGVSSGQATNASISDVAAGKTTAGNFVTGINESGGRALNRLYAKVLAGDADTFDSVSDGTTYRRIVGVTSGQATNASISDVAAGKTTAGNFVTGVNESGGKALNRLYAKVLAGDADNIDSVNNGTTYSRPLATRINAGRPILDFSEGIHSNKQLDYIGDGSSYARVEVGQLSGNRVHKLTSVDVRNDNQLPSFYQMGQTVEFKNRSIIGAPGSATFGQLTTDKPWSDASGGEVTQTFRSVDGAFKRESSGMSAWGSWRYIIEATTQRIGRNDGHLTTDMQESGGKTVNRLFAKPLAADVDNIDSVGNGTTYSRPLATRINAGRPVLVFSETIHVDKSGDYIQRTAANSTPIGTALNKLTDLGNAESNMLESGGKGINRLYAKTLAADVDNADSINNGTVKRAIPFSILRSSDGQILSGVDRVATISGTYADAVAKREGIFFQETFESGTPGDQGWENGSGGTGTIVASVSQVGRYVWQTATEANTYKTYPRRLPYNPSKLYRVRVRIRQTVADGNTYVGIRAYDQDGNPAHQNSGNCYTPIVGNIFPAGVWQEITSYFKGASTPFTDQNSANGSFPGEAPCPFPIATRYISPFFLLNYAGTGTGITQVDYFMIEELDEDSSDRTFTTLGLSQTFKTAAKESGGKGINRLYAKVLAGDADNIDSVNNGTTYSRPLATRINAGKPLIDFSEAININKSGDYIQRSNADGTTQSTVMQNITNAGNAAGAMTESSGKAINRLFAKPLAADVDNLDSVGNGTTYSRPLATRINAGRPVLVFSETIHTDKTLQFIDDTTTRYASPVAKATSDIAPLIASGGMSIRGNRAECVSGATWGEQVYSKEGFTNGAAVQGTIIAGTSMMALNTDPATDASYASLDYAIYVTGDPTGAGLQIYESGGYIASVGSYAIGDAIAVVYDGSNVRYMLNGTVLRAVAVGVGIKFFFDSSWAVGGVLENIRFGPQTSNAAAHVGAGNLITTVNESGGKALNRLYAKVLAGDADNIDSVNNGTTYSRPLSTRISAGKPLIDFSEAININKSGDYIQRSNANGTALSTVAQYVTDTGHAGSSMQESGGKGINRLFAKPLAADVDNIDSVGNGTTYSRPLATRINAGRPVLVFSETIHVDKTLQYIDDTTTRYAAPVPNASSDLPPLVAHANTTVAGNKVSGGTGTWGQGGAYSREGYALGAVATFRPLAGSYWMAGLNTDPATDHSYASIDYAWFCVSDQQLIIYESGASIASFAAWTTDDVLSVVYDGSNIRYLRNGVVQRTVAVQITAPLYFDIAIVYEGVHNLKFGAMSSNNAVNIGAGNLISTINESSGKAVNRLFAKVLAGDADSIDGTPDGVTYKRIVGVSSGQATNASISDVAAGKTTAGNLVSTINESSGKAVNRLFAKVLAGDADSIDGTPDGVTYKRITGVSGGLVQTSCMAGGAVTDAKIGDVAPGKMTAGNLVSTINESSGKAVNRLFAKVLAGDADSIDGTPDGVTYKRITGVSSGLVTSSSSTGRSRCKVYNLANQTINSSTETVLTFDTENHDVGGLHDHTSGNGRITIPTGGDTGVWLLMLQVEFDSHATGYRAIYIKDQAGNVVARIRQVAVAGSERTAMLITIPVNAPAAGNWYTGVVYQTSGVSLGAVGYNNSGYLSTYFAAVHLW